MDNYEVAESIVSCAYENGVNFFEVSDAGLNQKRSEVALGRIFANKGWNRRTFHLCTRINWIKFVKFFFCS